MNKEYFEQEMIRARTYQRLGDHPDYWAGYMRGLRRTFHGNNFGTQEEHEMWISFQNENDERRRWLGRGYVDGLKGQSRM